MSGNGSVDSYRNMLLSVSQTIDNEDLQRMKFRCSEIVKKRQSEKIKTVLDFFSALEERSSLGINNLSFLKELLSSCCSGKTDGLRIIDQYEGGGGQWGQPFGAVSQPPPPSQPQPQIVYVVQSGAPVPNGIPNFTQSKLLASPASLWSNQ